MKTKITELKRRGYPKLERVDIIQYNIFSREIKRGYGIIMPPISKLNRENMNKYELHVLLNDYQVSYETEGKKYTYKFRKGFIYDKASVPNALRSIVDNDSYLVAIAALVHDALFALHLLSFRDSDRHFYRLIRYAQSKQPRKDRRLWKAIVYWFGVISPIGHRLYRKSVPHKHWNYGKCIFNIGDCNE